MKNKIYTFMTFLSLGLGFSALSYTNVINAQSVKIGVVDADKIMQSSKIAIAAQQKILKETELRKAQIDALSNQGKAVLEKFKLDAPKLNPTDLAKRQKNLDDLNDAYIAKQNQYEEEIAKIKATELNNVIDNSNAVIKTIAAQEKFDIILQDAVYVNPSIDITEKVMSIINQ
jgi:outer membrane protein